MYWILSQFTALLVAPPRLVLLLYLSNISPLDLFRSRPSVLHRALDGMLWRACSVIAVMVVPSLLVQFASIFSYLTHQLYVVLWQHALAFSVIAVMVVPSHLGQWQQSHYRSCSFDLHHTQVDAVGHVRGIGGIVSELLSPSVLRRALDGMHWPVLW
jgi:hypothetical protein